MAPIHDTCCQTPLHLQEALASYLATELSNMNAAINSISPSGLQPAERCERKRTSRFAKDLYPVEIHGNNNFPVPHLRRTVASDTVLQQFFLQECSQSSYTAGELNDGTEGQCQKK